MRLEVRRRRSDETWINASRSLLLPPLAKREKNARRARIGKNDVSGRVYTSTRGRRIKLCRSFPGENTRRVASPVHWMPAIPDAAIQVATRRKMQLQEAVVALTRESSALSAGIYSERPWILMDPFSPAELSAGTTLICIMQFTCAIYTRAPARFLDIRGWSGSPKEYSLFLSFFLFIFYSHLAIRGFSRAIYLSTYNAIVRVASTSCFELK